MRRYTLTIIFAVAAIMAVFAEGFKDENLQYKVEYKWGLVNKKAGNLTLRLTNRADRYDCRLTGKTDPWADKVFKMRDTLKCEILKDGFLPTYYEKNAHEGKDISKETVKYSRSGNTVTGNTTRKKWKDGNITRDEKLVITAEGYTLDMLSAFFYMRNIPYDTWTKGQTKKINIFSGKEREFVTIKYQGKKEIEIDKVKHDCYHIKFSFTSKGGKKSSDDIEAWIETTGNHIPIKLEGSLPIGKIRCIYTGK